MLEVGDTVERNPANWWPIKDNDGGAGNQGTIVRMEDAFVHVTWDLTGKTCGYFPENLRLVKKTNLIAGMEEVEPSESIEMKRRNLEIYEKMMFSDFIVICETNGARFPCHKVIIAASSAYFARMLESGMIETSEGQFSIQGYESEVIEAFIKFLYVPTVDKKVYCCITFETVDSLHYSLDIDALFSRY